MFQNVCGRCPKACELKVSKSFAVAFFLLSDVASAILIEMQGHWCYGMISVSLFLACLLHLFACVALVPLFSLISPSDIELRSPEPQTQYTEKDSGCGC